eukprot:CAMPEP_0194030648 /NCGR_PEP_ID=MMETSP0009_2-20130614/4043_1 /TAXON_ID=210454 /ORGANISM="Grammatophora oceanica, Strain CCMP 410" /LENGTH=519 /DNA_ID=CAMNT_0038670627 /DNA_START=64 /DNA_END=1623 /DNA_ORIENTATION=-
MRVAQTVGIVFTTLVAPWLYGRHHRGTPTRVFVIENSTQVHFSEEDDEPEELSVALVPHRQMYSQDDGYGLNACERNDSVWPLLLTVLNACTCLFQIFWLFRQKRKPETEHETPCATGDDTTPGFAPQGAPPPQPQIDNPTNNASIFEVQNGDLGADGGPGIPNATNATAKSKPSSRQNEEATDEASDKRGTDESGPDDKLSPQAAQAQRQASTNGKKAISTTARSKQSSRQNKEATDEPCDNRGTGESGPDDKVSPQAAQAQRQASTNARNGGGEDAAPGNRLFEHRRTVATNQTSTVTPSTRASRVPLRLGFLASRQAAQAQRQASTNVGRNGGGEDAASEPTVEGRENGVASNQTNTVAPNTFASRTQPSNTHPLRLSSSPRRLRPAQHTIYLLSDSDDDSEEEVLFGHDIFSKPASAGHNPKAPRAALKSPPHDSTEVSDEEVAQPRLTNTTSGVATGLAHVTPAKRGPPAADGDGDECDDDDDDDCKPSATKKRKLSSWLTRQVFAAVDVVNSG